MTTQKPTHFRNPRTNEVKPVEEWLSEGHRNFTLFDEVVYSQGKWVDPMGAIFIVHIGKELTGEHTEIRTLSVNNFTIKIHFDHSNNQWHWTGEGDEAISKYNAERIGVRACDLRGAITYHLSQNG